MTMTPEQLREWVEAIRLGEPFGITRMIETLQGYADALEELAKSQSALTEAERKCEAALEEIDRLMCGQQHSLEHANALLTKRIERLKFHAEATADMLEEASSGFIPGCGSDERWNNKRDDVLAAYRAEFKEES